MNAANACLNHELLQQLEANELTPQEIREIEDHVNVCEKCRAALEDERRDSPWHEELVSSLKEPFLKMPEANAAEGDADGESGLSSLLSLLGPTDDPQMLGRIGSYEVVGVIGRGGMGVVFKAFDAALNRFVAIKMLLPHLAASGAARKRFAREGQAAAAVIDDNVMPIHTVAEWQGIPYLVTPYSRGINLQKRIHDQGPLELKEILRIGMQVARGLAAAHAQGLVHRDVKPSNILLDGTVERAMLTDFGLARAVDDTSMTRTGIIAGTPQYMSPEQARGGTVDSKSDLFGLGCVMYAMCTGRPPFRAENSYAVLRLITDAEPRPIREINSDIPDWLCELIGKLMSKSPSDRFASATEVASLLEACLAHVQQPLVTPLPEPLRPIAIASWRSTHTRWIVAIGALVLGLIGLFGVVISLRSPDGTLVIESAVDDVTVRVSQGDTVVRKLSVTKSGTKIDVAAGSYVVSVDGNVDGIVVENDNVNLRRGATEIVKLSYQRTPGKPSPAANPTASNIPRGQTQLSLLEKSIVVTDVRSDGQVLYFTLKQKNSPEDAMAFLEIQFYCEKAMPFVWTGPEPDAATVMWPQHTINWNEKMRDPRIPLPLATEGHKVAFIFPDKDSAVVAAKQLAAIGDQSLLAAQRRANDVSGRLKDEGLIFGESPSIGRYRTEFRVLGPVRVVPTPAANVPVVPVDVQLAVAMPTINWRQVYIGRATEPQLVKKYQITAEQHQRMLEIVKTLLRDATPATRDAEEKRAQTAIQELLTVDQDRRLRRDIWISINATRLRTPTTQEQLDLDSDQRQRINEIWLRLEAEIREHGGMRADGTDSYESVIEDTLKVLTPKQRELFLFKLQDPVFGTLPGPLPRVWMPEDFPERNGEAATPVDFRVSQVRTEEHLLKFTLTQTGPQVANAYLEIQFHCDKTAVLPERGVFSLDEVYATPLNTVLWIGPSFSYPWIKLPIHAEGQKVCFAFPDHATAVHAARQLRNIGDQNLLVAQRKALTVQNDPRTDGIICGEHPSIGLYRTHFRLLFNPNNDTASMATLIPTPESKPVRFVDALKLKLKQAKAVFPLIDQVREDMKTLDGDGLQILENAVKADLAEYKTRHPELGRAFETWQIDFRDVHRAKVAIPRLCEDPDNQPLMVGVARLLMKGDFKGQDQPKLAELRTQLGTTPTDAQLLKFVQDAFRVKLPELSKSLQESGARVPHTGTHEEHLKSAEELQTQYLMMQLYDMAATNEKTSPIRGIERLLSDTPPEMNEAVELGTATTAVATDRVIVFQEQQFKVELRPGETQIVQLPEGTRQFAWHSGDVPHVIGEDDARQVFTFVICDRAKDGAISWRLFGRKL